MPADQPTILATSGGYRAPDRGDFAFGPLVHHAVDLSGAAGRPRICQLGTASGDQRFRAGMFAEAAHRAGFDLLNLNLFPMPTVEDVEETVLAHDVVWVHGGSVVNLLAVWRAHNLDRIMRRAWEQGVVLAGISAGSICWYRGGTTDSYGPPLRPITDALGFLPYGNGVHYDAEAGRRPLMHDLVRDGVFGEAHCTDDGVGLVYSGTELVEAVTERDGAAGYLVRPDGAGGIDEERLETRLLS